MTDTELPFADRRDAGRRLAAVIAGLAIADPVILALPRGGVPVGYEIARRLQAPLDILIARKIGAPGHEEYGIGAVVDGAAPLLVLDEQMARTAGADHAYVEREVARQLAEIERRRAAYHIGEPVQLAGRNVILVDDGIATGGTTRVALKALASAGADTVTLAVPVAPASVFSELRKMCDRIVCLAVPEPFYAVGAHYRDFSQTEDDEVGALLERARSGAL